MRQMHHWAALLFVAAIVVHLLRIFFTGAFRRPRETNWIIGVIMLVLALLDGRHRLLAARRPALGHRPAHRQRDHAVGPGDRHLGALRGLRRRLRRRADHRAVLHRPRAAHPGDPAGADRGCTCCSWSSRSTPSSRAPGRTEHNVVGKRLFPTFAAKATGLFFVVFGVVRACSAAWCRSTRSGCGARTTRRRSRPASQPDWYIGFLDGSTRLFPPWDINLPGNYTIPALFWPTVVIAGAMFTLLALYPIIERKLTGDTASHHLLQRPRDVPVRTSLGAMAPDVLRVAVDVRRQRRHRRQVRHQPERDDVGRPDRRRSSCRRSSTALTYRICLGLQQHDREVLEHGIETGVIRRLPNGEFIEVHQPLGPVDSARPRHARLRRCAGAQADEPGRRRPPGDPRVLHARSRSRRRSSSSRSRRPRCRRRARPRADLRPAGRGGRPSDGGRPQEPRD